MKKIILAVVFTIVTFIIIGIIFVFSGIYNVSAMEPDSGFVRWVVETTNHRSVESRAGDIKIPDLENPKMLTEGIVHYKEMCETCHGGPGKQKTELAKGLNPGAPDLVKWGVKINPAKIFWITKYGIKMTGMPAWGKTHSDDKIWAIVAAVKKLHDLQPAAYNSIKNEE